jgi:hypothetical protein
MKYMITASKKHIHVELLVLGQIWDRMRGPEQILVY